MGFSLYFHSSRRFQFIRVFFTPLTVSWSTWLKMPTVRGVEIKPLENSLPFFPWPLARGHSPLRNNVCGSNVGGKKTWEVVGFGRLGVWEFWSLGVWQFGRLGVLRFGSLAVWGFGSLGV